MKRLVAALSLGLLVFAACASQQKGLSDKLQEAVEAYNHAFRWKNFERAVLYIPSDLRADFMTAYEDDQESLQVDDWQVRGVKWEGEKAAVVSIRISYLLLPSTAIKNVTLAQHWANIDGNWVLESEDNSIKKLGEVKAKKPKPSPKPTPEPSELPEEPEFK
ncbi:MAG: hypothetical protein U1E65_08790 [Myxococcota bacterium]